jgi:ferredoxin-type protein NapH
MEKYLLMLRIATIALAFFAFIWCAAEDGGLLMELLWIVCWGFATVVAGHQQWKKLPGFAHRIQVRNWAAIGRWSLAAMLTTGYGLLYWFPKAVEPLLPAVNDLSIFFRDQPGDRWWLYGVAYTLVVLSSGVVVFIRYRHDAYQRRRTLVVAASQLVFAFLLPAVLQGWDAEHAALHRDWKLFWPLDHEFFSPSRLDAMRSGGAIGRIYFLLGAMLFFVVAPVATYFWGKRWYCSWICGCGGLAETAGDAFRTLSINTPRSWRWERWLIYPILVWITASTVVVLYGYLAGVDSIGGIPIYATFTRPYAFAVGALFSGVIGVGFYPLLGNRIWCRFGCPLAAYMGIVQRFASRFKVSTQAGGCISCGACTLHCEMGIDVRAYAVQGKDVHRSACVGCGICAEVCPRDVIRLESIAGKREWRIELEFSTEVQN